MRHFAESRLLPLVGSANHSDEGTRQDDVRNFSGNPLKLTWPARSTLNPQPSSHPLPLKTGRKPAGSPDFSSSWAQRAPVLPGSLRPGAPRVSVRPTAAGKARRAPLGPGAQGRTRCGGSSADPGGNRGFWPWRGARLRVLESPRGPCALTLDVPRRGLAPSPLPVPNDDGQAALVEAMSLRKS